MAFKDVFEYEFNFNDASDYVEQYWDELETIYYSEEAPNGDKGKMWRQFHGKPQEISPLTVYLSQKIFDLEEELAGANKKYKKSTREAKVLKKRADGHKLEVCKIQRRNELLLDENEELKCHLDTDTARSLMESIKFLSEQCKKHNILIKPEDLPHYTNISPQQVAYLKSLVEQGS
ncbi:hypothetical protein [Nitrincola nitratireducens]|nr:hypothetical protein [Nitrincola nitratireducens]